MMWGIKRVSGCVPVSDAARQAIDKYNGRPRIYFAAQVWFCRSWESLGLGDTPAEAYHQWQQNRPRLMNVLQRRT